MLSCWSKESNRRSTSQSRCSGMRWWWAALLLGVVLATAACAVGGASSPSAPADAETPLATVAVPSSVTDLEQTFQTVIQRVQPSIVEVQSAGSQGQAIGSGDVITSDGYIVTNDHVVHGYQRYAVVLATGQTLPATLIAEALADDLAVLKVSATGLRPIIWGDSGALRAGALVLAIGSPLGLDQSVTFGIVSALHRTASESGSGTAVTLSDLIQTSAPINPGNSGGALVNLRGELIGVPTLGVETSSGTAAGIGFALPANRVRSLTDQLLSSGQLSNAA